MTFRFSLQNIRDSKIRGHERLPGRLAEHIDSVNCEALLTDFNTESGSFWRESAIDCLRAISDGVMSVECRHTNLNLW
jgi:hypothetical protein